MTTAVIPPEIALPLIQNRLERLTRSFRDDPNATAGDFALLGIVEDLADVVAQLAQQVTQ